MAKATSLSALLSRPIIMFWTLPWLMVLLVAGTVAQKYVGLYIAQNTFFSSFFFWWGPLPLPGGYSVTALIFVSLLAKFITESRWSWQRAGIILTHFGALVLLAGGLLTAITAREGFVVIDEGAESALVEDYHARVLTITKDGDEIFRLPQEELHKGRLLGLAEGLPFNAEIIDYMVNGTPQPRKNVESKIPLRGPAEKVEMIPTKPEMQNENNHGAVNIMIRGTGTETDGRYLMTEVMPLYPQVEVKDHAYELRFSKSTSTLPFALALIDVEKDNHPGGDMARAYRSTVTIKDGDTTWPAEISMNNPLRYRGYTFYQSSYMVREDGKETTVLSVVWNAGRLFPYIASAIISFGLILHLLVSTRGRRIALVIFGLLSFHGNAQAAPMDMSDFRMIPVLHEGRLKPLETFAQAKLHEFSGRAHLDNLPADQWLAELLFDPVTAAQRPTFLIRNRNLQQALRLPAQHGALYTLAQVSQGLATQGARIETLLQTPPDKLEARQKALLDTHQKVSEYTQLMRSFSLVLPLAVMPPDSFLSAQEKGDFAGQMPDYMALRKFEERANKKLQEIIRKRGEDLEKYSDEERAIALFAWQLQTLSTAASSNHLFRVIPVTWNTEERVSPWAVLQEGQGSPATAALLEQWKALGMAWLKDDKAVWRETTKALRGTLSPEQVHHFQAERFYNSANPFQWALALYVLSAGFMIALIRQHKNLWLRAGLGALVAGGLIHLVGLAARIYILARPPVGTLYESLLFVSLICVLAGGLLLWKRQDAFSGLAAALSGALLLVVSLYFGAMRGDSLSMLVAVLNTNFWLATHVLIVTTGYGLSIIAAMLAHAWLFRLQDRSGLFITMHRMALAALLFTAVGTILGGIWADQSWGRFWGWDPKENGALLIVLWIVWLLHGRLAGQLKPLTYAIGIAALNMVVALAWFGVNLLSVGLHSYGFISGIASGLTAFCVFETLLIAGLAMRRLRHE